MESANNNSIQNNISLKYRFVGYFANANDFPCYHIPIFLFYAKDHLGLSFSTTILIFYGLGFLTSFFEIPAGSIGDKYGRKLTYLLGVLFSSLGFAIWLFSLPLIFYIFGSILCGFGMAMISGSISSMIYEEYHVEKCEERYHIFQSRSKAMYNAVRLFAMPLGAYMYTINYRLPLILTIVSSLISGSLVLFIQDKNKTPEHHNARSLFKKTLTEILHDKETKLLCVIVFLIGAYGNIVWRMFQPAYQIFNFDIKYIGYFYSFFAIAGILGSLHIGRQFLKNKLFKIIFLYFLLALFVYALAAYKTNIYTISICVFTVSYLFPIADTSITSYLQHKFERYQQATILSVVSFLFVIGLTLGDVVAGVFNSLFDLRESLVIISIIGVVLLAIVGPIVLKNIKIEDNENNHSIIEKAT